MLFAKEAQRGLVKCLADEFAQEGGDEVVIEHVGTLRMPAVGDRSRAFRVVVAAQGSSDRIYFDVVFVQRGRVVAMAVFYAATLPLDREPELVRKMISRA